MAVFLFFFARVEKTWAWLEKKAPLPTVFFGVLVLLASRFVGYCVCCFCGSVLVFDLDVSVWGCCVVSGIVAFEVMFVVCCFAVVCKLLYSCLCLQHVWCLVS